MSTWYQSTKKIKNQKKNPSHSQQPLEACALHLVGTAFAGHLWVPKTAFCQLGALTVVVSAGALVPSYPNRVEQPAGSHGRVPKMRALQPGEV